jgi:glycolate oxidase FAD binding subunit
MSNSSHITETLTPADSTAVADAVHNACEKNIAVYPVGGGTMLDCGAAAKRQGVALSFAGLNHTIDYPVDDMTITVEAGVTVAELNHQLAANRQRLPVDVPQADRATIGGAIAVGSFGPRRFAYGTLRDYVLGFTAVDGQGTLFSGGGRVVKNAAGYNMNRLMVGSFGTLGLLTQVTLMVRPQCEKSVFLVGEASDFAMAEKLLADLIISPARPAAIELVAGSQRENDAIVGSTLDNRAARLCVGFEGATAEVDWMVDQLRSRWKDLGVHSPLLTQPEVTASLWQQFTDDVADLQIHVLPSKTIETIEKTLAIARDSSIQAHAGDGILRVQLNDEEDAPATNVLEKLRDAVTAYNGHVIVRRPLKGVAMTPTNVWGPPCPEQRLLRSLKERFDPKNILNPGRFVFD